MKGPENCFLEIILSLHQIKRIEDDSKSVISSSISWSKSRNFNGDGYIYEGVVKIDVGYYLHYFFSNKRSYLSITCENETDNQIKDNQSKENQIKDIEKLSLYVNKLFKVYKIDEFIYNIINDV